MYVHMYASRNVSRLTRENPTSKILLCIPYESEIRCRVEFAWKRNANTNKHNAATCWPSQCALDASVHPLNEHLSLSFPLDGQYKPRTSIPTTSSRQRPAMRRDAHKASKRRFVAAALWRNSRCAAATDRFAICQQSSRKTIHPRGRCIEARPEEEGRVEEK